jgi:hypothetical protein
MSEFELNQLLLSNLEAISDQFQFWMTATFAVVVASYTAGHRLSLWARVAVAVIYVAAVAIFYVRWQGSVQEGIRLIRALAELGYVATADGNGALAGLLRRLVMWSGTILAVVLICAPSIGNRGSERSE